MLPNSGAPQPPPQGHYKLYQRSHLPASIQSAPRQKEPPSSLSRKHSESGCVLTVQEYHMQFDHQVWPTQQEGTHGQCLRDKCVANSLVEQTLKLSWVTMLRSTSSMWSVPTLPHFAVQPDLQESHVSVSSDEFTRHATERSAIPALSPQRNPTPDHIRLPISTF